MSTVINIIEGKCEEFANAAASLLHITNEAKYEQALSVVKELLAQASDDPKNMLNGLVELISRTIADYEAKVPALVGLDHDADCAMPDV